MSKWVKLSVAVAFLALTFAGAPFASASGSRTAATCQAVGICSQSCRACVSNQGCPDYPNEFCLCGQHYCP